MDTPTNTPTYMYIQVYIHINNNMCTCIMFIIENMHVILTKDQQSACSYIYMYTCIIRMYNYLGKTVDV